MKQHDKSVPQHMHEMWNKLPSFFKTIRFRLTFTYFVFLAILIIALVIAIYISYTKSLESIGNIRPVFPDKQSWLLAIEQERLRILTNLRYYSIIGIATVLLFGVTGGYLLASVMLRPVDHVSRLAARISYSNLKERILRSGPDDEIKRLADTFDDMLVRLDTSVESQNRFIQDASHELRTPIAVAQANIEVLEMDDNSSVEDYRKLVEILKHSLERISSVSNSLILLSEGVVMPTKMTKNDLNALLMEVFDEVSAKVHARGLEFEYTPSVEKLYVQADAIRIKQVAMNLLDNAVKYSKEGGKIAVSTWKENGAACFEVTDDGIGIPAKDLPYIFERFFRVDKSRTRDRGGSGLGLTIVKKIVEEHGGSVMVRSNEGKGTSFKIILRLQS